MGKGESREGRRRNKRGEGVERKEERRGKGERENVNYFSCINSFFICRN